MKTNKTLGLICAILAATIYGCTGILGKVTYAEGSNTMTLTMFRSLFSAPVLFCYLKARGISLKVTKQQFKTLMLLGLMGATLTSVFLYGSYNYISVGLTTCIHFVYPVIVAVVSVTVFKDKISKSKIIAIVLSVVGLAMFLEKDLNVNMTGIIFAFLSGVAYSIYVLAMDKGGVRELHPMAISFYCCCVASVLLFCYGTATAQLTYDITPKGWVFMFIMAMCVSVGANSMIPVAVKHVGGTVTSIMGMFEPISTVILGYFVLNETMTLRGLAGCVLVIAAVVILTLEGAIEKKKA
ncbi:MAG: DMT family transporter [Firmicutes bacterium]|nr:DMT family transporter [Bacillota bacterium]